MLLIHWEPPSNIIPPAVIYLLIYVSPAGHFTMIVLLHQSFIQSFPDLHGTWELFTLITMRTSSSLLICNEQEQRPTEHTRGPTGTEVQVPLSKPCLSFSFAYVFLLVFYAWGHPDFSVSCCQRCVSLKLEAVQS